MGRHLTLPGHPTYELWKLGNILSQEVTCNSGGFRGGDQNTWIVCYLGGVPPLSGAGPQFSKFLDPPLVNDTKWWTSHVYNFYGIVHVVCISFLCSIAKYIIITMCIIQLDFILTWEPAWHSPRFAVSL
jgi:hypothetical protein